MSMGRTPTGSLVRKFDQYSPNGMDHELDYYSSRHKRRNVFSERKDSSSFSYFSRSAAEAKYRNKKGLPSVTDYSDPFSIPNLMEELDNDNRYGSVTKDIEALCARKIQILNPLRELYPSLFNSSECSAKQSSGGGLDTNKLATQDIINLDDDDEINVPAVETSQIQNSKPVEVIDLDEEDGDQVLGISRPDFSYDLEISKMRHDPRYGTQVTNFGLGLVSQTTSLYHAELERRKNQGNSLLEAYRKTSYDFQEVILKKPTGEKSMKDLVGNDSRRSKVKKEEDKSLGGETASAKSKGVYVGVQDDLMSDSGSGNSGEDDGLGDIWREMNLALECSKSTVPEQTAVEEEGEECDHSFVLKDDLGYVCRVCGVIEKSIETIFDFQWVKGTKTTRGGYISQSRSAKDGEQVEGAQFSVLNASEQDFGAAEISVHPRHMKQMKPHQLEGFNFLLRNLVSDNPGGCILAHAPGSGKTFMIISFMQSFLAKYPNARPLVVLPKGILGTWKKEFERWQVEEIPLYDLYTSKADNRTQQLDVLKEWVEHKGILFLGYKQFSSIVSNSASSKAAAACHDILLKVPTILILDEGHTPRNESTDVLVSLAKVQTPRKVVLSGTLFQNHVKEVFNILNLVRPKFLKLDTSRAVVRRVMSRVQISGVRKHIKSGGDSTAFYDLVEETLQNDQDFRRKVTVIQDLREMTSKVLHYYKGDFLEELPGLVDLTVLLTLSPKQKHAVEKLRKMEKFKRSSMGSAVYVHPQLKEYSENSTTAEKGNFNEDKIDALLDKVDIKDGVKAKFFLHMLGLCESAGEKLLVFSQYLLPLKFLERLVVKTKGWSPGKEIFVISGDSSQDQREWSMDRFNNSQDAKVFFGSIKACGEGISLVGASRLLILDVHLNPSVTRQAIGRAFRPGQTRKVYTYRLVAADSPEEEDHNTCFRKELISKMWFEWSEYCGYHDFEMESVDMKDLGDLFWDSPLLGEDVKALCKRGSTLGCC
ncbi:SNF2-related [Macleaya cordata]|uniref:SNF2-related n=1 Tax=Macleaya cordata TaxID=56857 RepID=A0A200Q6V7_MACCD|nr:SNF2-related [Macleaya cordata]